MSIATEIPVTWRLANFKDMPALIEIEQASMGTPWTSGEIEEELDKPMARFWVVEREGRLAAFGIHWFVVGEAQLANIAVHPDFRRQGLGKKMMMWLLEDARSAGMEKMTLEVRTSNAAAHGLYLQLGFRETCRRPRFYENQDEAILMEMDLK